MDVEKWATRRETVRKVRKIMVFRKGAILTKIVPVRNVPTVESEGINQRNVGLSSDAHTMQILDERVTQTLF